MTSRRSARAYLDAYRARCVERNLDPATGDPYVFVWPAERQQPEGLPWWCSPELMEAGEAQSPTEREAMRNLAAEARYRTHVAPPEPLEARMAREFRQIVREVLSEERTSLSLREIHARRGAHIEYVDIGGGNTCAVLVESVA